MCVVERLKLPHGFELVNVTATSEMVADSEDERVAAGDVTGQFG